MTAQHQTTTNSEIRNFKVSKAIIISLIKSQAGTPEKAMMENIMNAIDAGATRVEVTTGREGYTVDDNGRGFESRDQVEAYFETFGFDHADDALQASRTYGQFGIGRGQQWNWARTSYRSRTFDLQVDIRANGLDYTLISDLKDHPGTVITGEFYEPFTNEQVFRLNTEIKRLVKYSLVPISLNGQQISVHPDEESWTLVTDDAYMRVTDGYDAKVYNIGMLVGNFRLQRSGAAGIIVSKHPLNLNMARNDVLEGDPMWARINKAMLSMRKTKTEKRARLTEDDLRALAQEILQGDTSSLELAERAKLITDTNGRSVTIFDFANKVSGTTPVMLHDETSRYGNAYAHQEGFAYVLHPKTLERWDLETPEELVAGIRTYFKALAEQDPKKNRLAAAHARDLEFKRVAKDIRTLLPKFHDDRSVILDKELSKEETALIKAMHDTGPVLRQALNAFKLDQQQPQVQRLQFAVGRSEGLRSWWGDANTLVIERRLISEGLKSADAFMRLLMEAAQIGLRPEATEEDTRDSAQQMLLFLTEYLPLASYYGQTLLLTTSLLYKAGIRPHQALVTAVGRIEKVGDHAAPEDGEHPEDDDLNALFNTQGDTDPEQPNPDQDA